MRRLGLLSAIAMIMVLALPAVAFAQDKPTVADLSLAVDTVWVLIAAVLVIFMQAGFAMLEVGFSRMKNVGSVVAKILVNLAIAAHSVLGRRALPSPSVTGNAHHRHSGILPELRRRIKSTTYSAGSRGLRYHFQPSISSRSLSAPSPWQSFGARCWNGPSSRFT